MRELPDFLTVREVAAIFRISPTTAYKEVQRFLDTGGREGIPVLLIGGQKRIPRQKLEPLRGPAALGADPPPRCRLGTGPQRHRRRRPHPHGGHRGVLHSPPPDRRAPHPPRRERREGRPDRRLRHPSRQGPRGHRREPRRLLAGQGQVPRPLRARPGRRPPPPRAMRPTRSGQPIRRRPLRPTRRLGRAHRSPLNLQPGPGPRVHL